MNAETAEILALRRECKTTCASRRETRVSRVTGLEGQTGFCHVRLNLAQQGGVDPVCNAGTGELDFRIPVPSSFWEP